MPRWVANLLTIMFVVGLLPFLVLTSVFLLFSPQFIAYEYGKPDFPPSERFTPQQRQYYATESIEYELGNRNFEQFKALGVYNDRELNHMVDVRVLFGEVQVFHRMVGVLLLVILITLIGTPMARAWAPRALLTGSLLTLALFFALGLYAGVAFDSFFYVFHKVFFEGDSGFFNFSDSLIQFYPERFWFDAVILVVAVTVVGAIAVGAVGWFWGKRTGAVGSKQRTPESAGGKQ